MQGVRESRTFIHHHTHIRSVAKRGKLKYFFIVISPAFSTHRNIFASKIYNVYKSNKNNYYNIKTNTKKKPTKNITRTHPRS